MHLRKYICSETQHAKSKPPYKLHEFSADKYRDITSYNAFSSGQRRYASAQDAAAYWDRCCWGPTALYHLKHEREWLFDVKSTMSAMESVSKITPGEFIMQFYGVNCSEPEDIPRIVHASIWDFYKAIGFDYKRRCYIDARGQPLKFSLLS